MLLLDGKGSWMFARSMALVQSSVTVSNHVRYFSNW